MTSHRGWLVRQALVWGVGAAVLRFAIVPAERCPAVDAAATQRSVNAATAWLVRALRPDGTFLYGYRSDTGAVSPDYNGTRHAGVLYILYRVGRIDTADAGLRWVRDNLVNHGDWTAFAPPGEAARVGATSLTVAALAHRRLRTGDDRYDALLKRLGRFLVAQTRSDGSVLESWSLTTERRIPDEFGKFSTGEALYALALLHRVFPGEGWDRPAHHIAEYIATRRDRAEHYTPRQADHWAAYGLAELGPSELTDTERAYARDQAGWFGYQVRFVSQHTGRPLNPFTESGADLGVVGEGTAALWRLSGRDARLADLREPLGRRLTCLAGVTVGRQASPTAADPRTRGAWFLHDRTQMDDQQHAIGSLLGATEVLR